MGAGPYKLENRESVAEAIRRMDVDDLQYLNRLIVDRIKLIAQARSTTLLARFGVGDRVGFQSPIGSQTGIIIRLNKKTASIQTDDGHQWNVSPGLLTPVSAGQHGETEMEVQLPPKKGWWR
jgi:hypothetical protein